MALTGKRIILTGGSGGLGQCVAAELLREGAGVTVMSRTWISGGGDSLPLELLPQRRRRMLMSGKAIAILVALGALLCLALPANSRASDNPALNADILKIAL